jgi:hypothetical protein
MEPYRRTVDDVVAALGRRYLTNVCQSCAIKHRCTTGVAPA